MIIESESRFPQNRSRSDSQDSVFANCLNPNNSTDFQAIQTDKGSIWDQIALFLSENNESCCLSETDKRALWLIMEATQSPLKSKRKKAEEELLATYSNSSHMQVFQLTLILYKLRKMGFSSNFKQIVSYLRASFRRKIDFSLWSEKNKIEILILLVKILSNGDFQSGLKRQISHLLETWMEVLPVSEYRKVGLESLKVRVINLITEQDSSQRIYSAALICSVFVSKGFIDPWEKPGLKKSFFSQLTNFCNQDLKEIMLRSQKNWAASLNQILLDIEAVLEVAKCIKLSLKSLLGCEKKNKLKIMLKIASKEKYFKCLDPLMQFSKNIFDLVIISEQKMAPVTCQTFFLAENLAIQRSYLFLKKNILESFLFMVRFYIFVDKCKEKLYLGKLSIIALGRFTEYLKFFLEHGLSQTVLYLQENNFDTGRVPFLNQECISIILQIACEATKILECSSFFYDTRGDMLLKVIQPLMQLAPEDYEEAKENPEEFWSHDLDAVTEKKSQTLRSNSALLLCNICQNIDGFLPFYYKELWRIFRDETSKASQSPGQMALEIEGQGLGSMSKEKENSMATLLLSISTLNVLIRKSQSFIEVFNEGFRSCFEFLVSVESKILQSRFALFVYSATDLIQDSHFQIKIEKRLMREILEAQKEKDFSSISCVMTMEKIISQKKESKEWALEFFEELEELVKTCKKEKLFDFLMRAFEVQTNSSSIQIEKVLRVLVFRIEQTVLNPNPEMQKEKELILKKCIEILEIIAKNDSCISSKSNLYDGILSKILELFGFFEGKDLQASILDIFSIIVQKSDAFLPSLHAFLGRLPMILKDPQVIRSTFQFIVSLLIRIRDGRNEKSESILFSIRDILLNCMRPLNKNSEVTIDFDFLEQTCALVCFFVEASSLSGFGSLLEPVIEMSIRVYRHQKSGIKRKYSQKLAQVFLTLVHYHQSQIVNFFNQNKFFEEFFQDLFSFYLLGLSFATFSDKKLLILGLLDIIILLQDLHWSSQEDLFKILFTLIGLFQIPFQPFDSIFLNKNPSPIELESFFEELREDSYSIELPNKEFNKKRRRGVPKDALYKNREDQPEIDKQNDSFNLQKEQEKLRIAQRDEFKELNFVVSDFKSRHPDFWSLFLTKISPDLKKKLSLLLSIQTIGEPKTVRRIIKAQPNSIVKT